MTDDFLEKLRKEKNNFNKLIDQAMNIDKINLDKGFDVNKYLPKDDIYSSKVMRKYKNIIGSNNLNNNYKKEYDIDFLNINKNSISEIPNDDLFDNESIIMYEKKIFDDEDQKQIKITSCSNSNNGSNDNVIITSSNTKQNSTFRKNGSKGVQSFVFTEIYAEKIPFRFEEENVLEDNLILNEEENEIEKTNKELESKSRCSFDTEDNFNWYCLDFTVNSSSLPDHIEKFLNFEI